MTLYISRGSMVKNLPAKQETWVPSLVLEDRLEKEVAIHSSILAMGNPWIYPCLFHGKSHGKRSLVGYSPEGHKRVRYDLATK